MKAKKKNDPFLGTWVSDDEFTSEVEYTVSEAQGQYNVTVIDTGDGEEGEVQDVYKNKDGRLCFSVYWPSSGRLLKCTFLLVSDKQVKFIYTYTDHETMHKKRANKTRQLDAGGARSSKATPSARRGCA